MYFTYVLLCGDGNHYIGYTNDVDERFRRHSSGYVFATKGRLPVQLIFYEAFVHQQDATRREQYFKTTAGKKALKLMLREYFAAGTGVADQPKCDRNALQSHQP